MKLSSLLDDDRDRFIMGIRLLRGDSRTREYFDDRAEMEGTATLNSSCA